MNDEIKRGDVVRLKSGGPLMTVGQTDLDEENPIECVWFAHHLAVDASTESFHPDMLVNVEPTDGEEHRRESIRRARIEGAEKAMAFEASGECADPIAAVREWAAKGGA